MIFKVKSKSATSADSVALADIVINLFVFFFITFGLNASFDSVKKGNFPIDLPKASSATLPKSQKNLTLSIDRTGNIYLGPWTVSIGELKTTLNHELTLQKNKDILIQADRSISLQTFISILDVVKTTKAHSVAVETIS